MKRKYMAIQGLMIVNQLALTALLCVMNINKTEIPAENAVHIILFTSLFGDGYYVSSKNVKGNPVLSQFAILLLLFGWYFGLYLFGSYPPADAASVAILPICSYQLITLCLSSTFAFFADMESFYIFYTIQFAVSLFCCIAIAAVHRKRVWFVLRSQRKQLIFSTAFVLLPFSCYMIAFSRKEKYVEQMGLYLIVMLAFVGVHSIIFPAGNHQKPFFSLNRKTAAVLFFLFSVSFGLVAWVFDLPVLTSLTLLYLLIFW